MDCVYADGRVEGTLALSRLRPHAILLPHPRRPEQRQRILSRLVCHFLEGDAVEGREDARDLTRRVRFVPAFDGLAPYELFLLDVGNQVAFLRRWRLNELKSWSRRVPCDVRGDASS